MEPPVLDRPPVTGLTEAQVAAALRQSGYNEVPSARPRSILRIAFHVLREPMLLLLLGCCGIYFFLGDARDASILAAFVWVVVLITLYQQHKTERALEALRDLSSPRALVIREGRRRRIAGREVVPGDLLVLLEGDRVPADGFLLSATNLAVDESLLTGESVPVRKMAGGEPGQPMRPPGGDDLPFVYSGSLVVRGSGIARAESTGLRTELGRIGKAIQELKPQPSRLEQEAGRLVRIVAMVAVAVCTLLVITYGLTRGAWLSGFLAGLTLAMAILPEELPVVLTVFLALGAWRISRLRVLTRQTPAIEALGAASVLCLDKTGTLTLNRMAVKKLFADGELFEAPQSGTNLPEKFRRLAEFALLASRPDAFDPMDTAIRTFAETALGASRQFPGKLTLAREYPLSPRLLAVSEVWQEPARGSYVAAAKGAPEAIADLCNLPAGETHRLLQTVSALAGQGLRVLGVAGAAFQGRELPEDQHGFPYRFLGLVALADPLRPAVPAAVRECREAGIRVVMITGDYPETAASIARESGLREIAPVITGPELAAMRDEELSRHVGRVNIFARVVPEQKLRLVNALKSAGEIVAMTGDGVNDAPALKSAHIGIAMGERGTDVAREAAALVLLDDDFSSIVHAVRMGRRIFDNLRKAASYTLAIHVPIAGLSLIPVLLQWPLILKPVHIAFLELIIDPACSVVFEAEAEEPGIMSRPPRPIQDNILGRGVVFTSILQGAGILVIMLAIFGAAFGRGQGEADARTLTFTTLVLANVLLIQSNRSWSRLRTAPAHRRPRNAAMSFVSAGALIFLAGVLFVPFLRELFDFSTLHPSDLLLCLAAGLASFGWFEVLKRIPGRWKLR